MNFNTFHILSNLEGWIEKISRRGYLKLTRESTMILPLAILISALALGPAAKPISDAGDSSGIRVVPVPRTPEPATSLLTIAVPEPGKMLNNPVWIQFRVEGYALGADSQFDRADEVANSKMGQTIHVVIDNYPYFPINEPAIDPFDEQGYYYYQSYKFEVPYQLDEGVHTIRIFPARSFGESLKGERVFHSTFFYLGSQDGGTPVDLSKPYLTYNEPSDQFYLQEGKPVLLDFFLTNCELSQDGYKVKVTIDGKSSRMVTSWQPYYIYGLKRGDHTVRLQLLDSQNKQVSGPFNDVERTFTVN